MQIRSLRLVVSQRDQRIFRLPIVTGGGGKEISMRFLLRGAGELWTTSDVIRGENMDSNIWTNESIYSVLSGQYLRSDVV